MATAIYADGSAQDITRAATWSSSAPGVVAFDAAQRGLARAVGPGTVTISATFAGQGDKTAITVN